MRRVLWMSFLSSVIFLPYLVLGEPTTSTENQSNSSAPTGSQSTANHTTVNQTDWQAKASVTYETGKYGTGVRTDTVYIPFTLKRYFDRWDVALTIPYIYQNTGSGITFIDSRPLQTTHTTGGARTSNEGLGDIILKGGYDLLQENKAPLNLSSILKIKFPTADKKSGLGSGEFDETLGLESSKSLSNEWSILADIYYTFIGSPPGTDLNNEFAFDIGPRYKFSESWSVSVLYEQATALLDDRPDPKDILFMLEYKESKTLKFFGGISIGLSKGSPDTGLTLGAGIMF